MSLTLFDYNAAAYRAARDLLRETGKAAIVHPTGTGKSFIAFKFCEDFPTKNICWLSPSEYIFRMQLENLAAAGGTVPENVTFLTYAKLMGLAEYEIRELQPDLIILDEFHRCGAEQWGQGVRLLLNAYPNIPLLGLSATNIRYLDNRRDMAVELFDANIASEITLGEAIARGILQAPTYILSVYSYQKELKRYEARVRRSEGRPYHDRAEQLLETLRRRLEDADGLDDIFQRHMPDRHGKYIAFCTSAEHMDEMIRLTPKWFSGLDPEPHIYRAYSPDPATRQAIDDFRNDKSEHLKVLFAVDMLNEGVHVADVDGVILFRPTVSPIIYKQQIGRALSAGSTKTPVIFDVVNNIESLYNVGAVREEFEDALLRCVPSNEVRQQMRERFRVIDEVRDCRQLFEQLNDTLSASWDDMYLRATDYFRTHGDLNVPNRYTTEDKYRLGSWIATQRLVRKGLRQGVLSEERIAKLDAIGMVWRIKLDGWTEYYEASERFFQENGHLRVPFGYVAANGVNLGNWISNTRALKKRGELTQAQIASLNRLGMDWDIKATQWKQRYQDAKAYFEAHGDLNVPADYVDKNGIPLGRWLVRVRKSYAKGKLSAERIASLNAIGMTWNKTADCWEKMYCAAETYYRTQGNLLVRQDYVTEDGLSLGNWIQRSRQMFRRGVLSQDRLTRLASIGMVWSHERAQWEQFYRAAEAYYREHGNLEVPMKYKTQDGLRLGTWIGRLRQNYKAGVLESEKIKDMERIGMIWVVSSGRHRQVQGKSKGNGAVAPAL